jgi:predicted transcriptional regulator
LHARAQALGGDVNTIASLLLSDLLRSDMADPDADLTEEEWAAIQVGIMRGEADFAAGRFRSLDEVIADKEARFGIRL